MSADRTTRQPASPSRVTRNDQGMRPRLGSAWRLHLGADGVRPAGLGEVLRGQRLRSWEVEDHSRECDHLTWPRLSAGEFQRWSHHSGMGVAMGRGRPSPAPQAAKREQFAALIARGVSNSQACRIVGVNRRTGKRWRHGRTITSSSGRRLHYAPVVDVRKREISPRFLSEDERVFIGDRWRAGHLMRAIVRELGRDPATVSRELRRNVDPDSGTYRPFLAHRLAAQRRGRPRPGKLAAQPDGSRGGPRPSHRGLESGADCRAPAPAISRGRRPGRCGNHLPGHLPA